MQLFFYRFTCSYKHGCNVVRMMNVLMTCFATNLETECANDYETWRPLVEGIRDRYCNGDVARADKVACKFICLCVSSTMIKLVLCLWLIRIPRTLVLSIFRLVSPNVPLRI